MWKTLGKRSALASVALATAVTLAGPVDVAAQQASAQMQKMQQKMKQMMGMYSPELRKRVMALSPEIKQQVLQILAQHDRHSSRVTFRQVMHEVLADYQATAAAIATDNPEAAAEAARRLANHRIPKGGLFPYFDLDQINDENMGVLPGMNAAVEGSALKLAEAAEKGDMGTAAGYLSDIMSGCVACHQKFRGTPGLSSHLQTGGKQQ